MAIDPFGLQPFDEVVGAGEYALRNFVVRPGLEGPQVVTTWDPPTASVMRVMLRRKEREYPRDVEDGVLVADVVTGLAEAQAVVDREDDLLAEDAEPGDSRWWYYRAFVVPAPPPLAEQFAGRAVQEVDQADILRVDLLPVDVQEFRNIYLLIQNTDVDAANAYVETAPTDEGPWVQVADAAVPAGGLHEFTFADVAWKYLRVGFEGRTGTVTLIVKRALPWLTSDELSRPVLAYKTGRHIDLLWNGEHVPSEARALDEQQTKVYLSETLDTAGEAFLIGRDHDPRGPLYRFLALLSLELDRVHAYVESIRNFGTDLDGMPPEMLQHVAFELGYSSMEIDRPLDEVRGDLFRLADMWKRRGTSSLLSQVVLHEIGVVPRIQEGPGLIYRAADPDLWER